MVAVLVFVLVLEAAEGVVLGPVAVEEVPTGSRLDDLMDRTEEVPTGSMLDDLVDRVEEGQGHV